MIIVPKAQILQNVTNVCATYINNLKFKHLFICEFRQLDARKRQVFSFSKNFFFIDAKRTFSIYMFEKISH